MEKKLKQQKTLGGWLGSMKPHNNGCKCHLRAKRFFGMALEELETEGKIESSEVERVKTMLNSSDQENHYVALTLIKELNPHLFTDITPIHNAKNKN